MEAKDLVLLLAIPITLVTLIFYFSSSSITGAAIAQENQNNVIGIYSINPSFKAKFPYDLNDYEKVKESVDSIIKCAQEGNYVQSCVDSINNNDFEWLLGCDKGPEKVLYDLAEFYQDCFDSEDNDCICRKDMDISKEEITRYDLSKKEFRLVTTQDIDAKKISIKMIEPKIDLAYDVKTNGRSVWYPSLYIISYAEDKLIGINMFFTGQIQAERRALGPLKELILYKTEVNNLKVVDFVRQEGNKLFYPNNDVKELNNVRLCNLKPKNIYRFCATKKNSKIMAYDPIDGKVKERTLTIKFASYIPDSAPEPLNAVEVYEAPKAEKYVLVKWQKSPAKDISKYKIYFADSALNIFEKTPTEDLRKNPAVFSQEIGILSVEESDDLIIPNECEFDYQKRKCSFTTLNGAKAFIEKDKLYYFKSQDTYLYMLPVPEDSKAFDFSVTAIDKNNNEIDNIGPRQKLPVFKSAKSIDDLAPDSSMQSQATYDEQNKQVAFNLFTSVSKNIDGSKLEEKDFNNYKIYYRKYDKLGTDDERLIASAKLRDAKLNEIKPAQIIETKQDIIKVSIGSENPQNGNVFLFVIIATDSNGNPKEEQYKVKELGAVPNIVIS